ncbi:MAG: roadblock/LC7 domain-containing protein [Myxococcota bacterium]
MTPPRELGSFRDLSRRIPSAMRSDFGRVIENLMDIDGARGAVLVDDDGYAIDWVFDPETLTELDIQLIGAQVGQTVNAMERSAAKLDLGNPVALVESKRGHLVLSPVSVHYVLAFVLDAQVDANRILDHFEAVRSTVEHLLT